MHLLESYALGCGMEIEKPYIYDSYIALPVSDVQKYISFQPFGSAPCRHYPLWSEVTEILRPIFNKEDIGIVQIGLESDEKINGSLDMRGKTSINQAAYIIKNSILHLGVDSFGVHVASGYGKKIVGLYSNMLPSESGPYWSEKEDVTLISSVTEGEYASYGHYEEPQTISRIFPEKIAESICSALGIEFDYPYETLFIGKEYQLARIEVVPSHTILNWRELGVDSLIMRMDKFFNTSTLASQLGMCSCSIITDRAIDLNVIRGFRDKIVELVFFIDEETDTEYLKELKKTGVKLYLMSSMKEEALNKIKLKYLEIAPIISRKIPTKDRIKEELQGEDLGDIYYRSSHTIIKNQKMFKNYADSDESKAVLSPKHVPPAQVVDSPKFWEDLDRMIILKKK
jgi:hypothetical protein